MNFLFYQISVSHPAPLQPAYPAPNEPVATAAKEMTVNLKLEHPDIILVENLDDINTNALTLHVSFT